MAWLWIYSPGSQEGRPVPLSRAGLGLGRDVDNDLVVVDGGTSRHHARLSWREGTWWLEDLGSANGTWVGDARIRLHPLRAGEYFRLGQTQFVVADDEPAALPLPEPAPAIAPPAHKRRRGLRWALGAGLLAVAALAVLFGLSGFLVWESRDLRLLPSQLASLVENGWSGRLRPAALPETRTPAVDVRPHPALHLVAARGALDRPRSFSARPLASAELDDAFRRLPGLPVAGFELDGGMTDDDCLPGALRMSWDLDKLGVPPAARAHAQLVRRAPDGRLQLLATRLEAGQAVAELRHNGVFLLIFLGFAGWEAINVVKDQFDQGTFDAHVSDSAGPFRLFWPRKLALADTPERRRVAAAMKARWDAILARPATGSEREVWTGRYYAFQADPEAKRLEALMEDPAWKRANYYPPAVANSLDAFERAHEYLHQTRGFRRRGDQIEIHFLDPWNGAAGAFAYTLDGSYTYPYIHVNLSLVPARRETAGGSEAIDDLHTTALHELFHVVQKEYFNWTKYLNWSHFRGGGKFAWFAEATAVMIEEEAEPHYLRRGWVRQFKKTFEPGKFMGLYKLPLEAQGDGEEETQHKGYAASRFLLSLRDRYYAANRDDFLKKLMETFGSFRTGPVDAMVKVTSQSEKVLGADYTLFAARESWPIYNNVPLAVAGAFTRQEPRKTWKVTGPLSSPCVELRWNTVPEPELRDAKLMLRTHGVAEHGITHRWGWVRGEATQFRHVAGAVAVEPLAAAGPKRPTHQKLAVQRIESYTAAAWFGGPSETTTALLLLAPKEPPRLRASADRKQIHVEVPATPLWRLGESHEIRVRFHGSLSGKRPLAISLGRDQLAADIDMAQVMGTQVGDPAQAGLARRVLQVVSPRDIQDMLAIADFVAQVQGQQKKIRVSWSEVVTSDPADPEAPGVEGPESEIFEVPDEAQPQAMNFDLAGTWSGQVLFLHHAVIFKMGSPGQILMAGEERPFEVAGSAEHGGTRLHMLERVGKDLVPTGFNAFVYKLPGRKLWLTVPPTVLYPEGVKPEVPEGWWEALWKATGNPQ
ncbi:MAG: FHA domain-containing protein [Vicinamibacteria bacterium]|nr:FHA domain-containing protein [Vicinamibacteria bacterium]